MKIQFFTMFAKAIAISCVTQCLLGCSPVYVQIGSNNVANQIGIEHNGMPIEQAGKKQKSKMPTAEQVMGIQNRIATVEEDHNSMKEQLDDITAQPTIHWRN